jgi:hypothetical protein
MKLCFLLWLLYKLLFKRGELEAKQEDLSGETKCSLLRPYSYFLMSIEIKESGCNSDRKNDLLAQRLKRQFPLIYQTKIKGGNSYV